MTAIPVDLAEIHQTLEEVRLVRAELAQLRAEVAALTGQRADAKAGALPLADAARLMGMTPKRAIRQMEAGTLGVPTFRMGHRYFANRAAVERLVTGRTV